MMKVYRLTSGDVLYSFGEPIGDVPILGKPLKMVQDEIASNKGYSIVDIDDESNIKEDEYFVFDENIYFTPAFFDEVVNSISVANSSLQYYLKPNLFNERFVLPFSKGAKDICFNFKYIKKGQEIVRFDVEQDVYDFEVRMPDQLVKGGVYHVPQCETFATHIISPFHLLQANIALNLSRAIKVQKGKIKSRFKHLKGKLGVFFFYRALKSLNKIGKNCFIHPSAIIEGSIIGDNVKIGANAVVRLSHVGDDCTISDNVVVANSVLGARTYISNSNFIELCMTYEEAFLIHGPYQFSIFGKGSACFAVINCDFRLDQENIKIATSKGVMDSNQPLMGIAYGHGSKAGGGNIIAAGRIVPNGRYINPPDSIIFKFD